MSADDAWEDLKAVLEHYAPPCSGLDLFTADSRTDDERAVCSSICAAARSLKRRRTAASTTADRTVSGTQEKEEGS